MATWASPAGCPLPGPEVIKLRAEVSQLPQVAMDDVPDQMTSGLLIAGGRNHPGRGEVVQAWLQDTGSRSRPASAISR
jgi:hypothetical protein